ncbi:hypothetical protein AGMMS50276_22240 [Synergistales bacterium]|nr:hypothetical protein AGMMS50276_22240 [Synergistales bacterium]
MKKVILLVLLLAGIFVFAGIGEAAMNADEFLNLCGWHTLNEVRAAIKNGADVNAKDEHGATALMLAALYNSNPEVISLLLERGANANIIDKTGKRAIDYAEERYGWRGTEALKQLKKASGK